MNRQPNRDLAGGLPADDRAALGNLEPLAARLAAYEAPEPDPASRDALIARLRPLVAARARSDAGLDWGGLPETGARHWLRLARAQMALVEPAVWWAGALSAAIGVLVTLLGGGDLVTLGFTLAAPVLAAAGVAYVFRPAGQTLWEIERISPAGPLELLYARLALVFALDLAVSVALLGVVWAQEPRVVLWRLVLAWFGPMLALSGVALYVSVRWGTLPGLAVPGLLWGGAVFAVWRWLDAAARAEGWGVGVLLTQVSHADGVLAASLLCILAGALLLWQGSRLAIRETLQWTS